MPNPEKSDPTKENPGVELPSAEVGRSVQEEVTKSLAVEEWRMELIRQRVKGDLLKWFAAGLGILITVIGYLGIDRINKGMKQVNENTFQYATNHLAELVHERFNEPTIKALVQEALGTEALLAARGLIQSNWQAKIDEVRTAAFLGDQTTSNGVLVAARQISGTGGIATNLTQTSTSIGASPTNPIEADSYAAQFQFLFKGAADGLRKKEYAAVLNYTERAMAALTLLPATERDRPVVSQLMSIASFSAREVGQHQKSFEYSRIAKDLFPAAFPRVNWAVTLHVYGMEDAAIDEVRSWNRLTPEERATYDELLKGALPDWNTK